MGENKMNVTISVSSFVDDTSTGLRYTKINGGKGLQVTPINARTLTGEVAIPETFNFDGEDLPITAFGSFSGSNINNAAFYSSGLTSLTFESGSKLTTIGVSAFYQCKFTSISFANNTKLTHIMGGAFFGCNLIKSIELPSTIEYIGYQAIPLTAITFTEKGFGIVSASDDSSVKYWLASKKLTVTEITKEMLEGVKLIAGEALASIETNIKNVTKIEIPASLKKIICYLKDEESGSISKTAEFENLTSISVEAGNTVYNCPDGSNCLIETATNRLVLCCKNSSIPLSVKIIGTGAFGSCMDKSSFVIPSGVEIIEESAFSECSNLTTVTLPSSLTKIYDYAFTICNNLISATYQGTVEQWNNLIGSNTNKIFGRNEDVVVTCTDGTVTVNPSTTSGS